jgi:hypothetical protein
MEFSKYDDVGDPMTWLNRCEHYFRVQRTPENPRVAYAPFYLTDDAQLWYHRLELNVGPPPWLCFIQLVNKRFGQPLTDSPIGEIALLRRDDNVDDFAKRFMALSCRDTAITEAYQVQLFLVVLGKPLRIDVVQHRPPTHGRMNSARRRRPLWHLINTLRGAPEPTHRVPPQASRQPPLRPLHHRWPNLHRLSSG